MKTGCIKLFDKLIVVLLGATGLFAGCKIDDPVDEYGSPAEYGTPSAMYEINGTVTDAATSEPIRDIQVVRPWYWNRNAASPEFGDTTRTDAAGKYHFEFGDFPNKDYQLKFEDIDGEENGTYGFKTVEGEFTKDDQKEPGNGHWYEGKFVKTHNVALDEPMVIPMYGVPPPFQP